MASREEQLREEILKLKKYISSEISTIDRILDQMGYGRSIDNQEELIQKQELLEQQHLELRSLDSDIEKSEQLGRQIISLEDKIDNIQLYTYKSAKLEALKQEIETLTEERQAVLDAIEKKIASINNKSK